MKTQYIQPDWDAPKHIHAYTSTRLGGYSKNDYAGLNLSTNVGDDANLVIKNRQQLMLDLNLPQPPLWLQQVHGVKVLQLPQEAAQHEADGMYSCEINQVCAVLTADCLPALFCAKDGSCVAAAHAGWRGLLNGILEATVKSLPCPADELLVWLGPAMGATNFEVGKEVLEAFVAKEAQAAEAFKALPKTEKYLIDMYHIARQRLRSVGVQCISGGHLCTYSDETRFYSYRRHPKTGRMISLIYIT